MRWPIEDAELDELCLDLRNVRIPGGDLDETAIASYLVEGADLLDLARDILRDGYLDNELPVVADENGRRVVLEGNRRITALKAIHDPSLLGGHEARMVRLLSRYPEADTPTEIRVMIAPSREAAQPLLARLHTGQPKEGWLREQQAVFYHAQLSPTVSVNDLRARYPRETSRIVSFIRMGEMRELIRGLRYEDRDLEQFVRTSQMKMTAFEYAYERPQIQDALGLKFTKDGLLASKRLSKGQRRGLLYLLQRFQAKTLNTRSPELREKNAAHEPFVKELRRIVAGEAASGTNGRADGDGADAGGTGDSTGQSGGAESTGQSGGGEATSGTGTGGGGSDSGHGGAPQGDGSGAGGSSQTGARGANRGETRSRLDMDGFEYKGTSAGLRRRFEELKRLDLRDFPNAAHDLLRTVLECAIKDHFAAKGRPLPSKSTLGGCVEDLARDYQGNSHMTTLINHINRKGRMSTDQFSGTAASLNASNHEPDSFVQAADVHAGWERIKPILIEIVGK